MKELHELQRILHTLLLGYTEKTIRHPVTRLFNLSINTNPIKKLNLEGYNELLSQSTTSYLRKLNKKLYLTDKELINLIVKLKEDLENLNINFKKKKILLKNFSNWNININNLRLIQTIAKSINFDGIDEIILHGSYATLDYIDLWSDLDILIVIKSKYFRSKKDFDLLRSNILRAEKLLYAHNPLQHHGFSIIFDFDFLMYSEDYFLPLETLSNSIALLERYNNLSIFLLNDKNISIAKFNKKLIQFKEFYSLHYHPKNLYELKDIISSALNIPFTFLAAKGSYYYKRDSFREINKYLTKEEKATLDFWSNLRKNWAHKKTVLSYFKNTFIRAYILKFLKEKIELDAKEFDSKLYLTYKLLVRLKKLINDENY